MSFIDNYIEKRIEQNPELAKGFAQEDFNLNAGVIVRKMRDDLNMTQKEFASYVGKSQATISRIEAGSMNVSVGLLSEIANAAHRKIKLVLV